MPVGRLKERNPEGHSGHRKLHDVVGSIEILNGNDQWLGLPIRRE